MHVPDCIFIIELRMPYIYAQTKNEIRHDIMKNRGIDKDKISDDIDDIEGHTVTYIKVFMELYQLFIECLKKFSFFM